MAIFFHDDSFNSGLKRKPKIKSWIDSVIKESGFSSGQINIIFTSDEDLRRINIEYLEHDYYTDIISFDYSEAKVLSGDIYISIERVEENAKKYSVEKENELLRVIIHGILHLIGYKDSNDSEKNKMRIMEEKSLQLYYSS